MEFAKDQETFFHLLNFLEQQVPHLSILDTRRRRLNEIARLKASPARELAKKAGMSYSIAIELLKELLDLKKGMQNQQLRRKYGIEFPKNLK